MADDRSTAFTPRKVFVSHAHADKALAALLAQLLDNTFFGLLDPFFSSDPAPTGGMRPGEDWDDRIHAELAAAEAVWVLASPASIKRPWVYWEAGLGRALCPRGIVVLRVGLALEEVSSPLSRFQSYDGLSIENDGIIDLVGKLGVTLGMRIAPEWIERCAKQFVERARDVRPLEPQFSDAPTLSPEKLGRIEAVVSRLEAIAMASDNVRPQAARLPEMHSTASPRLELLGSDVTRYNLKQLLERLDQLPSGTRLEPMLIDADGDVTISVSDDERAPGRAAFIFLVPDDDELSSAERSCSGRAADLVAAIQHLRVRLRVQRE